MTIHSEHPFLEPESERDPVRRLRGRLGGAVALLTTGSGRDRAGLTVSSLVVADGEPAHALALIDPDSDLGGTIHQAGRAVVHLLEWEHRDLAEAFAGLAPAPGGVFTLGAWHDTEWGPRLHGVGAWAGVHVVDVREVGWSLLVDAEIQHVEIGEEREPLEHRRGRYARAARPR